jgi:hypothetical protein
MEIREKEAVFSSGMKMDPSWNFSDSPSRKKYLGTGETNREIGCFGHDVKTPLRFFNEVL